jgi:hypothetical protein
MAPRRSTSSRSPSCARTRPPSSPFLGYALGGDGKVFVSLLNRCSEEDQVLRDQAFSILACNVGKDGDVAQAKQQLGNDIGTTRALVTAGDISYVTADMAAPEQIRKNIEFLIREIYRMAHVRFEEDSKDAQSGESIRLQFTELNEQLANLAGVLQDAELQMAKAWYAWTIPAIAPPSRPASRRRTSRSSIRASSSSPTCCRSCRSGRTRSRWISGPRSSTTSRTASSTSSRRAADGSARDDQERDRGQEQNRDRRWPRRRPRSARRW